MKRFVITTVTALGIMVAVVPAVRAADTACPPNPTPGSTVNGNLIVPNGQTCTLTDVTVTGNVLVEKNARLNVENETTGITFGGNVTVGTGAELVIVNMTVVGNVTANQCLAVAMRPVTVGGNVVIENCTGQEVGYADAQIGGNFSCKNNSFFCLAVRGNVHGNVQIDNNGSADVASNTIGGNLEIDNNANAEVFFNTIGSNLECQGNETITGGGNTVGGHKQGQCAGF